MFKVRDEHLEALKPGVEARAPERLAAALRARGHDARHDPATGEVTSDDARGGRTRMTFRADGTPDAVCSPMGARWRVLTHEGGSFRGVETPTGETLEMDFDASGNVTALRRPGLLEYRLGWSSGMLHRVEYPDGTRATFTYGESGALVESTDRCGATTRFATVDGRPQRVIDPLGRETRFDYDADGDLRSVAFADGSSWESALDRPTRTRQITLRGGGKVTQRFGDAGRLEAVQWPDGSATRFAFGEEGRLADVTNADASVALTWTPYGDIGAERSAAGLVEYRYEGELLSGITLPTGEAIEYHYNRDGVLTAIRDWEGGLIRVDSLPTGAWSRVVFPSGVTEGREYGQPSRLLRSWVTTPTGELVSDLRYEYDTCDRLTALEEDRGGSTLTRRLAFDAEGRVLEEQNASGEPLRRYGYDAKGNLIFDCGAAVSIGPMDEPTAWDGYPIEWDEEGQARRLPSPDGAIECCFNGDGTLREVETAAGVWRYRYDGFGRRVEKTNGRETWRFGWGETWLLWEEHVAHPGALPRRRDYLYAPGEATPLAFREDGQTFSLQRDTRGAVVRAFDARGRVVWAATYDSFGNADVHVAAIRQPWRLAGQYEDVETGLYYNVARYYCPWLKTYLSVDPQWVELQATRYSYCRNDPWNRVDPRGTIAFLVILVGLAIPTVIGAIVGGVSALLSHQNPWVGALKGAITGFCTAAGAMLGAAGGPVGAVAGGILGGAVGTFLGEVVGDALTKDKICWTCALKEAFYSVLIDLALLGTGKFVKRFFPGITRWLDDIAKKVSGKFEDWIDSLRRRGLDAPPPHPDAPAPHPDAPAPHPDAPAPHPDGPPRPGGDPDAPQRTAGERVGKDGLTKSQRDYYKDRLDNARTPHERDQALYDRNCTKRENAGQSHLPPDRWQEQADRVRESKARGTANETRVLEDLGVQNNNRGENVVMHPSANGRTRPDGIGRNAEVEVKTVSDTPNASGQPRVLNDTEQMRAQRRGAQASGRDHVVVMTNNDPSACRPSSSLARPPPAGSVVLHRNSTTGEWSQWNPRANSNRGAWEPIPRDRAVDAVGGGGP